MFLQFITTIFLIVSTNLFGEQMIEVVKSVNQLTPVAIEDGTTDPKFEELSKKFHRLISNDMMLLTRFEVSDVYQKGDFSANSNFANRSANYNIKFQLYSDSGIGGLSCDVRLIDIARGTDILIKKYKINSKDKYPFLAHEIVGDINIKLGGENVDWLKKYVIFSRYTKPKQSEIVIGDYTLTYTHTIVSNGLNLFPKWADNSQNEFYFTRYEKNQPTLYKMNLYTNEYEKILQTDGMLSCSDISANGKEMLLTMAPKGQPDIYLYNLETKKLKQLTRDLAIDVSASFIDNDTRMAFVSDRLGFPNVFAQSVRNSENIADQLVFSGKNNNSCASYGKYIVYSARENDSEFAHNTFNLHLISTDTNLIRRLTASGMNILPKFSADGESILFIKQTNNGSSLGILRLSYNKSFLFPLNVGKIQSIDW